MAARSANVSGQNPEFIFREFQGMNNLAARESIDDNEFYWCENAIPIAPGKLLPVLGASASTSINETTSPTYATTFAVPGTIYAFVVFSATGNGYVVNLTSGFTWTQIITGLTSGQTYATPYNNQGLLIVDPSGYWDWNITAGNTLTPQNNTVSGLTAIVINRVPSASSMKQVLAGTLGTGAVMQTVYEVVNVVLTNPGTGYAVGDTINLTDNNPTTPAQIIVASITGGGATGPVATITLPSGGSYPGPTSTSPVTVGPTGAVTTTTGSGSGAEFAPTIQATGVNVLSRGTGYVSGTLTDEQSSLGTVYDQWTINSSGVISGTSIATYAGRVWLGYGRTVYFTDIDSYNSFGGVGGSFTIPDSYLVGNITVLYSANNYLYIFGPTSIDALSNVTVSGGVTSFSRINVTASVGCSSPASVFAYYRAIVFYNLSGIYLLAGATPEKISEKISGIIQNTFGGAQIYGGAVLVQGELCAAMQFIVKDTLSQNGTLRPLFVLFFRGRWFVYSFPYTSGAGLLTTACASIPQVNGAPTLYAFRTNGTACTIYYCFSALAALSNWVIKTKLWDGGSPIHAKQGINAFIAGQWVTNGAGVTINVDCENASAPAQQVVVSGTGYQWEVTIGNMATFADAQYLGLTVTGSTDMTQIDMLALRGKADRNMLAG